jgi:pimeloyl-ACP methyl ester carboxylesterase
MARWWLITGAAGLVVGVVAAGTGVVIAAEKIAVGRQRLQPDPEAAEPLGELRGRALTVLADDGVPLHAEINGPDDARVTVIFCHGYTLNQDCWHYQRRDLGGIGRLVFWDQRGHGRSGRSGGTGRPGADHVGVDQLGADLHSVLAAVAPGKAPVVLVGHSMGGMAIMALADQHPGLFGPKVIGVVLISTAASGVDPTVWMPGPLRPVARQVAGPMLRGVAKGRRAALVERSRQAAGDLAFLATKYVGFGDPLISPALVDFLERMIRATPVDVVAEFYLALVGHDKRAALGVLGRVPVVVLAGDRDRLVPIALTEWLAGEIPGAEFTRLPGAGHVVILERPAEVNEAITGLVARALAGGAANGRSPRRQASH